MFKKTATRNKRFCSLVLDDALENLVNLSSHAQSFRERRSTNRLNFFLEISQQKTRISNQNHKLLHGQSIAGVRTSINNVEGRNGHQRSLSMACQIRNVTIPKNKKYKTKTPVTILLLFYKGILRAAAPALQTAMETPRIAFAPMLP